MRVTNQYLYNNFKLDQQKVNHELKKLTEQVSSGKKIQNSYDDTTVYNDTLRLDTQIQELKSIQDRTQKAKVFTSASDTALQNFDESFRKFNTKLLAAANAPMNQDNLESIATELEKEKEHMMTLANTQIGGQYIFSGSATQVKPIDSNGLYFGNDKALKTTVGEGVSVTKNIDGHSLFLGQDENISKKLSTNVQLKNKETNTPLKTSDTIKDMIGDNKTLSFKLSGTTHEGSVVKSTFDIDPGVNIESMLTKIGEAYGNDTTTQNVKVELNDSGNITITDLKKGMSQLEFKLKASYTDDNGATQNVAFNNSSYEMAVADNSDSAYFTKDGSFLTSNVTQIADGKIADRTTKLSEIANGTLDNKAFDMKLTDINGNDYTVSLSLDNDSKFEVKDSSGNSSTYNIYNADGTKTKADDMTLGQLNNVISMVTSHKLPANTNNTADEFNNATIEAKKLVDVDLNQSGKMQIHDKSNELSKIKFSMYDTKAEDYTDTNASLSFMSNNSVTTQKSEIDFFGEIDEIIQAVRSGKGTPDSDGKSPRNIGIQNAIDKISQFSSHFNNHLAKVGVQDQTLTNAQDRAMSMEVNIKELKSQLTDVDIAETYMNLNQLSLNYQAILSSVSKINSLTLLNYMK